jgi:hypothetical protein
MKHKLLIIFVLLLFVVGGYFAYHVMVYTRKTTPEPAVPTEQSQTATPVPVKFTEHGVSLVAELIQDLVADSVNYHLQLAVEPEEGADIELAGYVFKFQLTVDQNINFKSDVSLEPNPELQQQQWAFPIQTVQPVNRRTANVELAGVHVSPDVFKWDRSYWVARIPLVVLQSGAKITLNFDQDTRFLTKQNERIPLKSNKELTIIAN